MGARNAQLESRGRESEERKERNGEYAGRENRKERHGV